VTPVLAGRDQLAGAQGQHDQQRAQPGPADLEHFSRGGADLNRPEHRDLHVLNSARVHWPAASGGTLKGVMTWMDAGAVTIGPSSAPYACMMIWQARCMSRRRSW